MWGDTDSSSITLEVCLILDKSLPNECRFPYMSALGKPPAGTGREVSSMLPVFPCAGRGNSRADREGITTLEEWNDWMGRVGNVIS